MKLNHKLFSITFILILFFLNGISFAEILFEETFEDTNFSSRGWYDGPQGTLSSSEHIPGSTRSFECRYVSGTTGCQGGKPGRHLFTETEIVYLSYWVKYSSNWVGSGVGYHPHEFYFITNIDSNSIGPAKTHLTAYVEQTGGIPKLAIQDGLNVDTNCILRNNDTFVGCNGNFNTYPFTENRSVASCNGLIGGLDGRDCYDAGDYWYSARIWGASQVYFQNNTGNYYKNDWHFIEAMFQMNSIQNGIGIPDGSIRYWYDGELLISYDNILLRTGQHPDQRFKHLLIAPYIGVGSPVTQTMWIDNLTVSTHRIGGNTNPTLQAPNNFRILP